MCCLYLKKELDKNKFPQKCINYFLIGIIIYTLSHFLNGVIPGYIINIVQLIALAMYFWGWIKLASWKNISSKYFLVTLCLLFLWQIYIVCHGFIFNYYYLKEYLFLSNRGIQYLIPLIAFILVGDSFFLQKLFNYIHKLGVVFLILLLFLFPYLLFDVEIGEACIAIFALTSGFILLTSFYHSIKRVTVSYIVILSALILSTLLARRNVMLICVCFLLFSFIISIVINKKIRVVSKVAILLLYLFTLMIGYNLFLANQTDIFSEITKRAKEDTRTEVFLFYFMDMSPVDFLIGKGINGTYYCPDVDRNWNGGEDLAYRDLDDRVIIECGYLQLILNGGIIYVFIYLCVLLPAIVLGLFFSRNIFSKACAILIIIHLIDMFPYGLPIFSFRYFLVWFCVAICYSKEMRMKDEEEMKKILRYT